MSWLDFANHFLSNQRLHAWSWINKTFFWEWFSGGEFCFECFGLFLFSFCLVRGEKVASAQDFVGNLRERTTLGRGFLFLVYLVTILYCLDIVWSKDLSGCLFYFLPILDREFSFLFFAFSHSLIGNFSFFFPFFLFSEGKDWHSHPGSRFMVSWDFGSRLVERLDMIYVRVWPAVRG